VHVKDYYAQLELSPSASIDEIKKSYRRLAHLYHPDKNAGDAYAAAQFEEIKEAYEVLTHPLKKDYYLQQRWYAQSTGTRMKQTANTPTTTLKQLLELERYIRSLDVHRLDTEGLYQYMLEMFSEETIRMSNRFKDLSVNREIVAGGIRIGQLLLWRQVKSIADRLVSIDTGDQQTAELLRHWVSRAKQTDYWERKKVWIVIAIVVILCLGIFLTSN
jgi:molecular chaperone DnaJ